MNKKIFASISLACGLAAISSGQETTATSIVRPSGRVEVTTRTAISPGKCALLRSLVAPVLGGTNGHPIRSISGTVIRDDAGAVTGVDATIRVRLTTEQAVAIRDTLDPMILLGSKEGSPIRVFSVLVTNDGSALVILGHK
jgi:hypothetical protein